jgi:hypothetical protein
MANRDRSVGLYLRAEILAIIRAVYHAQPADVDRFYAALLIAFEAGPDRIIPTEPVRALPAARVVINDDSEAW